MAGNAVEHCDLNLDSGLCCCAVPIYAGYNYRPVTVCVFKAQTHSPPSCPSCEIRLFGQFWAQFWYGTRPNNPAETERIRVRATSKEIAFLLT